MKKFLLYTVGSVIVVSVFSLLVPPFRALVVEQFANIISSKSSCPKASGNIFSDEILIHVNKDTALPADYIPGDLVSIAGLVKTTKPLCLKKDATSYLQKMFQHASLDGVTLTVTSGFRSPETQSILYNALLRAKGKAAKNRIAEPLHSEHQLGTTFDLTGKSIKYVSASDAFAGTREELWLRENAYLYGFVLSYPKDKTDLTGYDYEPWHYRFVGIDVAKEIFEKGISVEEYFTSLEVIDML